MAEQTAEEFLGLAAPPGSKVQTAEEFLGLRGGEEEPSGADAPNPWGHLREALNAPVLGFGPELRAAGYAASHAGQHGGLGQAYHVGLENFQKQRSQYVDENPIAATAIDIAGSAIPVTAASLLTPELPGAAAIATRARLGKGLLGVAARTARSGARGALLGAEAGAMESKLDGGDLGQNTLQGAEVGGMLGLAGRVAKGVLGPGGPRLPIHHGKYQGFNRGIGMGLGIMAGHEAGEHLLSVLPALMSSPPAAATAAIWGLAAATGLVAVRAIRNAARREAVGLRGSNWGRVQEGVLRSGTVNALGGTGEQDSSSQ